MPNRRKFTDAALIAAVADSKTLWEVVQRVGLQSASGNLQILCFNCHGLTENWGNKRRGPVVE